MFPAPAGMNRERFVRWRRQVGVPRARGDEPAGWHIDGMPY